MLLVTFYTILVSIITQFLLVEAKELILVIFMQKILEEMQFIATDEIQVLQKDLTVYI